MKNEVIAKNSIPVVDLFAGPGGLSEGFSSVYQTGQRVFDVRLSIEKDEYAHKTLELRSFLRKFPQKEIPPEYYNVMKEASVISREKQRKVPT